MNELSVDEVEVAENHGFGLDPRKADGEPVFRLGESRLGLKQNKEQEQILGFYLYRFLFADPNY